MAQIMWTEKEGPDGKYWVTDYKGVRIFKMYGLLIVHLLDSKNLPTSKEASFKQWCEVTSFIDATGARA